MTTKTAGTADSGSGSASPLRAIANADVLSTIMYHILTQRAPRAAALEDDNGGGSSGGGGAASRARAAEAITLEQFLAARLYLSIDEALPEGISPRPPREGEAPPSRSADWYHSTESLRREVGPATAALFGPVFNGSN